MRGCASPPGRGVRGQVSPPWPPFRTDALDSRCGRDHHPSGLVRGAGMDNGDWLRSLGLGQYEATFRASEIEPDVLPDLTDGDLEKIGLPLGPRKRILKAIAALGAPPSAPVVSPTPAPSPDTAERRQLTVMFCDLVG